MPTNRCSDCNINYPSTFNYAQFAKCQVCGEPTSHIGNDDHHQDWEAQVTWKRRKRWKDAHWGPIIPGPTEDEPLPIYEDGGLFWISDMAVRGAGITPPNADRRMWLFRANGHVWETQGWDEPRRRWWIEEVCLEDDGGDPA